jgi:hypothetical protein
VTEDEIDELGVGFADVGMDDILAAEDVDLEGGVLDVG